MLIFSPEYEKLELPDLPTFLAGLPEEQRAQLRMSDVCLVGWARLMGASGRSGRGISPLSNDSPSRERAGRDHTVRHLLLSGLATSGAELITRREELLASLTKEQETIIKTKKEMKHKFDAVDTYLNDYAKVRLPLTSPTGPELTT